MVNHHNLNGAALAFHQGRDKAVHMVKIRQSQKSFPGKQLEIAAGIWHVVMEQTITDPVGQPRLEALLGSVFALFAVAGDAVA